MAKTKEKKPMITQDNFNQEYADPIEEQQIRHFVCIEMGRQIHRYIKAMHGSKQQMLRFEEHLKDLPMKEKEAAIARYIDLNRKAIKGLDMKIVLARAMANYSDTFEYLVTLVNDKRKMVKYLKLSNEKESLVSLTIEDVYSLNQSMSSFVLAMYMLTTYVLCHS